MIRAPLLSLGLLACLPISVLAQDETPFGSPIAGSADGKVCRWRPELLPSPDDAPVARIAAGQAGPWQAQLSDGVRALLEAYPESFVMPVYPCRRAHQLPAPLVEGSAWNDTHAKLTEDGEGLVTGRAGILFRHPTRGIEVIWNHLTRYRGTLLDRIEVEGVVFGNGTKTLYTSRQEIAFRFSDAARGEMLPPTLLEYASSILTPAKFAGGGFLLIDTLNHRSQPRLSWVYDQSERRLRRLPGVQGDSIAGLSENLRTVDDTDMFNGPPDEFEWHLRGKRTLLVPYNSLGLMVPQESFDRVLAPFHLNPDVTRWEAHRVWVVEAILKPRARHIYGRRVFYVDEDSWGILMAENYDIDNTLWRVSLANVALIAEAQVTMTMGDVFHDLKLKRYSIKGFVNTPAGIGQYTLPFPPDGYFTPAAFRQRFGR